jgi:ABC-type spermidine/putrescine transport system permease subunit I
MSQKRPAWSSYAVILFVAIIALGPIAVPMAESLAFLNSLQEGYFSSVSSLFNTAYADLLIKVILRALTLSFLCVLLGSLISIFARIYMSQKQRAIGLIIMTCVFIFQPLVKAFTWRDILGLDFAEGVGIQWTEASTFIMIFVSSLPMSIFACTLIFNKIPQAQIRAAMDIGLNDFAIVFGIIKNYILLGVTIGFLITLPFILFCYSESSVFSEQEISFSAVISGLQSAGKLGESSIFQIVFALSNFIIVVLLSTIIARKKYE